MTKLYSIQFLRALAAILVVYHHILNQDTGNVPSWQQNFYHLKHFGSIGVDLFFVISGFIIMYIANTYSGLQQGINFLMKRFCRINPVYYIVTLLFLIVLVIIQLSGTDMPPLSSLNKLINSLIDAFLIIPSTANMESFSPLLTIGWTLSFEWLFYIIFFILILFKVKLKTFYLAGLIGLLFLLGQVLTPGDFRLIFLTNPIQLEFLLGVAIFYVHFKIHSIPAYISIGSILGGLSIYAFLIIYGFGNIWHYQTTLNGELSLTRFIVWGLPSSFIVAGCVFLETNLNFKKVCSNRWIQLAGDASFSIYLIHIAIFPLLIRFSIMVFDYIPSDLTILLQLAIAVTVSVLFYIIVEKPILKIIRNDKLWNSLVTTKNKSITYE